MKSMSTVLMRAVYGPHSSHSLIRVGQVAVRHVLVRPGQVEGRARKRSFPSSVVTKSHAFALGRTWPPQGGSAIAASRAGRRLVSRSWPVPVGRPSTFSLLGRPSLERSGHFGRPGWPLEPIARRRSQGRRHSRYARSNTSSHSVQAFDRVTRYASVSWPNVLQSPNTSMSTNAAMIVTTTGVRQRRPLRAMAGAMYH